MVVAYRLLFKRLSLNCHKGAKASPSRAHTHTHTRTYTRPYDRIQWLKIPELFNFKDLSLTNNSLQLYQPKYLRDTFSYLHHTNTSICSIIPLLFLSLLLFLGSRTIFPLNSANSQILYQYLRSATAMYLVKWTYIDLLALRFSNPIQRLTTLKSPAPRSKALIISTKLPIESS